VGLSHRLLIVEDDHDVREALIGLLVTLGWDCEGAVHGSDALRKLDERTEPPCLILLDLMMPVLDGRGFREEQLRRPELAGIPVVVISAFGHGEQAAKSMRAAGFLRKPIDLRELVAVVAEHCPLDTC
jgi:CheY-like chemotaxis protein